MKILTFETYEEYEAYIDKKVIPYDVITIIESENYISADMQIKCKKNNTAVRKFFETVTDYPDLMAWDGWFNLDSKENEKIIEEFHNYMTGKMDYTGNYSLGIEDLDGVFYIYMNIRKEYKQLTGIQYDSDYHIEKSIEWNKQTETIKEAVINHFEIENSGEWVYNWGGRNKDKTIIKNIKIENLYRDRITNEINFSYNYTIEDFDEGEKEFYISVSTKNGKIEHLYNSYKWRHTELLELSETILKYIIGITPEFNYLPAEESNENADSEIVTETEIMSQPEAVTAEFCNNCKDLNIDCRGTNPNFTDCLYYNPINGLNLKKYLDSVDVGELAYIEIRRKDGAFLCEGIVKNLRADSLWELIDEYGANIKNKTYGISENGERCIKITIY